MIIKFNIGLFPCQLAAVVLDVSTSAKEVHLVAQSTTTRTSAMSTLFQEWNWSTEYISVCFSTIEAPCFVISLRDDNSQVLETLAQDKWADECTTQNNKFQWIVCKMNFLFSPTNFLLVEDLFLSFDKQAHFPNLFLPLPFVIK